MTDVTIHRTALRAGLAAAAIRGRRSLAPALAFGAIHAAVVTLTAASTLALREVAFNGRVSTILGLFAAGSALGGFLAWLVAAAVAGRMPAPKRFAAMLATLPAGTAGGVALVYLAQFRLLEPDLYDDFPSLHFLQQLLFSGAGAAYTFMVSGLPLILPHGLLALFGAALWFARVPRG